MLKKWKQLLSCLLLSSFFLFSQASDVHATQIYDMATETNFNIRFDSEDADGRLGYNGKVLHRDLNNNGITDLIIGDYRADHGGIDNGSIYIIFDTLLSEISGTGNIIDLATSTNYNVRIDGPTDTTWFGHFSIISADVTYDGKVDLIIGMSEATYNGAGSSSVMIIPNQTFGSKTDTGNVIAMDTPSNFLMRIDGSSGTSFGAGINGISAGDIDGNGKSDLLVGAANAGPSSEGSVFVFFDSLLDNYSGAGNIFNLDTSSNYNIEIRGQSTGNSLGLDVLIADANNDGKGDVLLGDKHTDNNSRNNSGSIYYIKSSILTALTGTGNLLSLDNSTSYNIRYDGSTASGNLGHGTFAVGDIDGNGLKDFILNEDVTANGYVYVVYDSLIDDYLGTGNNVDLATGANYNVRIDGNAGDDLGYTSVNIVDIDNDLKGDLLLHALSDYNSRSNSGSMYVVKHSNLATLTGTGNILPLSNSNNYSLRYDGATANQYLSYASINYGDYNNDGSIDLTIGALDVSGDGNLYIIYNYPHINSLSTTTNDYLKNGNKIKGTITASNSVTKISGVQWSSFNDPNGNWNNCDADDGSFDSLEENYTCSITGNPDKAFIRSYDQNRSYTPKINYKNLSLVKEKVKDTSNEIPHHTMANTVSGFFKPSQDSDTGLQKVVVMIQTNTLDFHAFLSAINTKATSIVKKTFAPSTTVNNEAFTIGGDNVGFKTSQGTAWQVGNIQDIWYKAFSPENSDLENAKIIPDIQKKNSILALSYTDQDLYPAGHTENPFTPDSLKLAHSLDGENWAVLDYSVVDSVNKTVSIYDTIGGYYMIVALVK